MKLKLVSIFLTFLVFLPIASSINIVSAHRYGKYVIYLNCIDIKNSNEFVAYFGYNNKRNRNQKLRKSEIKNGTGIAPKLLIKGEHNKVFTAVTTIGEEIVWSVRGGGKRQIAKANANSVQCSNGEEHIPVSYPEAEDDPEYTDDEEITDEIAKSIVL